MEHNLKIVGALPFSEQWLVGNTPAFKVPSHGTDLLGVTYAYDFMAVNNKGQTSSKITLNTIFGTENPKDFYSFGKPILTPVNGKVIKIHDNETDNKVRRSLFAGIPYMLTQKKRLEERIENITGNYIIIQPEDSDNFICIVHIKKNSFVVKEGDIILVGEHLADCGNSGNSTQPHIHIQAMNNLNLNITKGIPLYFKNFIELDIKSKKEVQKSEAFPNKNKLVRSSSNN